MLQIGNKPIDTMYVGGKLVQQAYMGSKKVYPLHGVIPKAIKDSMVLWYDIKRQGATNETMSVNPILKDLSGNGHDATCYNFAWSGMSGVGGYGSDFSIPFKSTGAGEITQTNNKIEIHNWTSERVKLLAFQGNSWKIPSGTKIRIHGLSNKYRLTLIASIDGTWNNLIYGTEAESPYVTEDGEYTTLEEIDTSIASIIQLKIYIIDDNVNTFKNIVIEQLPLYPNALVSDGVDDYCFVEGLPLLNKEDGYTVIAKRKLFNKESGITFCKTNDIVLSEGAFSIENGINTVSFGGITSILSHLTEDGTIYQTSSNYNDKTINIGDISDTNFLFIAYSGNTSKQYKNIALYSLLLFDRDLTEQEIEWVKKNMVEGNDDDVDWYGVEFYTTSDNPDCVRIGNPELHKKLPVHSQMKGCLLADDGTVNKYLNESDWTGETLDGSQGQVMVEMPKTSYWKFETDGNIRRVKFSTKPLPGFKKTPQGYVSAYEAALQSSTNKLSSVVNTTADYRGGNNNTGWDGTYRSLLGMPATQISRTNFRNYARNRKVGSTEWNLMTYDMHKLMYWLFVVEYATLNTQKPFNSAKASEGYAQGGLGDGVTTLDGGKWNTFNGYNPFIPCGHTDELGNGTGQKEYSMPSEYDATIKKLYVPRYRGVENPFGHIWQWTDGINVRISPNAPTGDGLSKVYICSDPSKFNDTGYDGYTYVGDEARTAAYVKELIFGEGGEIMPKVVGGSSSTYFCDYRYMNIPTTETLRGVLFGGDANNGALAGFVFASSNNAPSYAHANIGSRLCFIPNNN